MSEKSKEFVLISSIVALLHRCRTKAGKSTPNLQFLFFSYSVLLLTDTQKNAKLLKL